MLARTDGGCGMMGCNNPVDEIRGRIDALVERLPRAAPVQIAEGVEAIRRLARESGFDAVEVLARQCESAIGAGRDRAAIRVYLDAMHDAAFVPGLLSAFAAEAWLASVATRLAN